MKAFWKNFLVIVVVSVVGFFSAIGGVMYMNHKGSCTQSTLSGNEEGRLFKQPYHLTALSGVAAENTDFTYAAEQAIHAVVHIRSVKTSRASRDNDQVFDPFEFFFGFQGRRPQMPQQPRVGSGSGVIISSDGYVLTNNHVIEHADEIFVTLNDNREFKAKVVGADPETDIALLKVEAKDLQTLPFGDSEKLKIGEWVLAVGNPFNLNSTVTAGIVSAKGRDIVTGPSDRNKIASFIQTDAAVNPGNSGGALVNTKGELIGINTAIYSETGNFAGYSFAVPMSIAGKVVADLKEYGAVQRAMLGVSIQNAKDAAQKDKKVKALEGVYVAEFAERSSAKEAGVQVGDVIISVNGVTVKTANALQEQISKYRPGDKVNLGIDRYGATKSIKVTLRNARGGTEVVAKSGDSASVLGAAFRELTDEQKREFGVGWGIEVNGLDKGKIRDAGIRKGYVILMVNNVKISTPEELYRIVDQIVKGSSSDTGLLIKGFYPNGRTQYYAIDLVE